MPPTPFHLLRTHSHPLHALAFSPAGHPLLYAGDEDGYVSITDLRLRRVVASWRAHDGGVLSVTEWRGGFVSHGRDNLVHFHSPTFSSLLAGPSRGTGLTTLMDPPPILKSLPVNALNFCRASLVEVPGVGGGLTAALGSAMVGTEEEMYKEDVKRVEKRKGKEKEDGYGEIEGLIAVPNLTDNETVDIYALPSLQRLHAAVLPTASRILSSEQTDTPRSGLVMALNIHFLPLPAIPPETQSTLEIGSSGQKGKNSQLRMVVAFEDGRVESWRAERWWERTDRRLGIGKDVWVKEWSLKGHNEAIMAMSVSPTLNYAFSVSADHLVCRYSLATDLPLGEERMTSFGTKQIGNACVAVSGDGRVLAVGGWDGSIRLFSTKSFKLLGTLEYHREACHVIAFPPTVATLQRGAEGAEEVREVDLEGDEDDSDEEVERLGLKEMSRWMVSGGKDKRVALWELKDFARK